MQSLEVAVGKAETNNQPSLVKVGDLRIESPYKDLFVRGADVRKHVKESIGANGYDPAFPVVTWGGVVVDGHVRLEEARLAGIENIWAIDRRFENQEQAVAYAIRANNGRKLTGADQYRAVLALDAAFGAETSTDSGTDRTAKVVSALMGIGEKTVNQIRLIKTHGSPDVQTKLVSGELSLKEAAALVRLLQPSGILASGLKPPYKRLLKALGKFQPQCAGNPKVAESLAGLIAMLEREDAGSQPASNSKKEVAAA